MKNDQHETKPSYKLNWTEVFKTAKCYVIITKNVDGENPDEEPTVETLNTAVNRMRPFYPCFYDVYIHGMQLIVVLNMSGLDDEVVRSLAARELSNIMDNSQHSE
jgi:hypothetical protein